MSKLSLRARLLWVSLALLLLFLSLTAWVLDQAFVRSVQKNAQSQLQLHVYGLLTAAEDVDGKLELPEILQEPRFNRLSTGLFGWVVDSKGQVIWQSVSSEGLVPTSIKGASIGEADFRQVTLSDGGRYRLAFSVIWEAEDNSENQYTFIVSESASFYETQINGFRRALWGWLIGLTVVLLVVQFVITTWGLGPLKQMAFHLHKIEKGESDRLEGEYPKELSGVVTNLNLLIDHERRQRERYKNSLGDLAHSLKTPLAVVKGSISLTEDHNELKRVINEQTERMDSIVAYQLKRAIAASPANLSQRVPLLPLVKRITGALDKVYRDKAVQLTNELVDDLVLGGDESDFYEVFGNVLDNAYKHCRSQVKITYRVSEDQKAHCFAIEDDGQGIPEEQRQEVLNRGTRADTSVAGQGIGLSVVRDIIESYNGEIKVDSSDLGGARISIDLKRLS